MKLGHLKNFNRFAVLSLGLGLVTVGCSLAVTRPIQEMANAEVAIKAAKDLNADSLVPEIYRSANESFYKAKRDFRLKDFDNARKGALKATRLAEQAEFEAYRMGGATPEAGNRNSQEGSFPDAEDAFREGTTPAPTPKPESSPESSNDEASAATEEPGVDYNEYQRQQQEAADEAGRKEKEKDAKKPAGQTGPVSPSTTSDVGVQTGALPPAVGLPTDLSGYNPPKQDLRIKPESPRPQIYYEGAKPLSPTIEEMEDQPINAMDAPEIQPLGQDSPREKSGLDELKEDEASDVEAAHDIPEMGKYAEDFKPTQKDEKR